ncbi:EmrB/QacA subfamily drug resistance transporter [Micromonospora pisi]|uniref:EmrB/QacA subfamily drug resistance transporter n=1 Tax=Micromonospora pisi TaxID=589240 RepID=A0A495JC12_9ACTN|nr:MFS transporter [Micromonospora pisi]RKR86457.1 EmrB/QacA subfamily drug resistance transporter [Micromonospora pisi]
MSESMTATTPTRSPDPRRWRILGLVGVAQLMLILDVTVVAIALPHMGADLDLRRETLTWVVSGYTLAFGGLLLLGGRAADLFGARRLVLAGLLLFAAASLTAGLATSGPMLLSGRVAQGMAAAMLSPAALSLIVTIFDGDERNRALGIWSALGGSGAALGVLLGGVLTAGPGWTWIFFINVPVGLVLLFALRSYLPAQPAVATRAALDVPGAALVTAATATLIYALIRAGDHGWFTWTTAALLATSAVLYAGFMARQRLAANPLMNVRLLTRRPVATGTLLILVATALMIMMFFLGTFALQEHYGYGALTAGLLFLPIALSTMLGANAAGRVIGRTGPRTLAVAGLLVAAAGLAIPAIWDGAAPMVVGMTVAAAGTGSLFVVASATALGQVAAHEAGLASGIVSTFHEFGASLGAAVASSVAAVSLAGTGTDGFARGFTTGAVVAVVAAAAALAITPNSRSR